MARSEYKEAIQAIELRSAVVESETQQAITQQANQKKLDVGSFSFDQQC